MMSCLLVIDNDAGFCRILTDHLESEGFEITPIHDAGHGLQRALERAAEYDLIVLDVALPGLNGLEVLRHIRSTLDTPVLILAGSRGKSYCVESLEMGADDCLIKPFSLREFVARVRAILRRTGNRPASGPLCRASERIVVGDIELDTRSRDVCRDGERIELTSHEFNFLEILLRATGRVVTRKDLTEKVLGRAPAAYDRSLDVHISNIRRKLGREARGGIDRIKTVRKVGYIYVQPSRSLHPANRVAKTAKQ